MSNPVIYRWGDKYWYNEKGQYHREDGPAIEYKIGNKYWYQNDILHRIDGPAVINRCRVEYWINGKPYSSLELDLMNEALE